MALVMIYAILKILYGYCLVRCGLIMYACGFDIDDWAVMRSAPNIMALHSSTKLYCSHKIPLNRRYNSIKSTDKKSPL